MQFRWFSIQVNYHSQEEADAKRETMQRQLEEMADDLARGFTVQFAVTNGDAIHVFMTRKNEN